MATEVQGFLANLTLDSLDITDTVQSAPFTRSKGNQNKAVMDNTGVMDSIPGVESGTLSISGFITTDEWNAMEITWAKDVPVPFVLTVAAGLTTDPGWAGNVVLTSLEVNPAEDGLWEFALDGDTSGITAFTPSVV